MAQPKLREGDTRSFRHVPLMHLRWWPTKGPLRWKPEHGKPECLVERLSQWTWSHRILLYIAVVTTMILLVQLFDVSLVGR